MAKRNNKFSHLKRNINTRNENKSILIVCGGEKTEPNYFKKFEPYDADIYVENTKKSPLLLVQHTLKLIDSKKKKENKEYDSVWCVFDKDDFEDFDNAIQLADQHNINVAYSNKCFELWILMHFGKAPTQGQEELRKEVNRIFKNELKIKEGYLKNSEKLYDILIDRQKSAISLAKQRYNERELYGATPSEQLGVTKVHFLVNELNNNSPNRWN